MTGKFCYKLPEKQGGCYPSLMITSIAPTDWQDLQNQVAHILDECGFKAEVAKKIMTVRGEVEVDVYAEETIKSRTYKIICECKHWRARVPQGVIQQFRSVIADSGAHKGYIVSSAGFQSGSFSSADLTNIELVTWEEFQVAFEQTWLEHCFTPVITHALDPLMTYSEPFAPKFFDKLPEREKEAWVKLHGDYAPLGWLVMSLSTYGRITRKGAYPPLPLSLPADGSFPGDEMLKEITGYRELLAFLLGVGTEAIAKFREIRDRNGFGR